MSKYAPDGYYEAAYNFVAAADQMDIVTDVATPTNLNNSIASVSLTPGAGNGDYTIGEGDAAPRKLTVAGQPATPITGNGAANHLVLSLSGVIKYVSVGDGQALVAGGTVDIPSWDIEIDDPA